MCYGATARSLSRARGAGGCLTVRLAHVFPLGKPRFWPPKGNQPPPRRKKGDSGPSAVGTSPARFCGRVTLPQHGHPPLPRSTSLVFTVWARCTSHLPQRPCKPRRKIFAAKQTPTSPHRARPRCHRNRASTGRFASQKLSISTQHPPFYDLIALFRGFSAGISPSAPALHHVVPQGPSQEAQRQDNPPRAPGGPDRPVRVRSPYDRKPNRNRCRAGRGKRECFDALFPCHISRYHVRKHVICLGVVPRAPCTVLTCPSTMMSTPSINHQPCTPPCNPTVSKLTQLAVGIPSPDHPEGGRY